MSLLNKGIDLSIVLDSLDTIVYIANMETYEIVYINEYTRNIFGDIVGKICWQSLQSGQTGPCDFCTNDKLVDAEGNPTGEYRWEFRNTTNGKWYDIRDSAVRSEDGRLLRLEIATDITQSKKTQNALRLSQFAVEKCADAVFWMGPDARFVYVNDSACRSIGYTRDELLSMTIHDIDPYFPEKAWPEHWEKIRGNGYCIVESRHLTKDGRLIPVEKMINYFEYDGQEYNCAFARDITERKKADEAFNSIATTFSTISGNEFFNRVSGHLANTLNMDYAMIGEFFGHSNKVKILGGVGKGKILQPFEYDLKDSPCENVIGKSLRCYPSNVRELFPKDTLLIKMGIESYIGAPLFNWDGKPMGIMALMDTRPISDQTIAENMFKIFTDRVSAEIERMRSERKLHTSEEKFSKAFRSSPDMIAITRLRDHKLIEVNEGCIRTLGFSREEIIGKSTEDLNTWVNNEDRDRYINMLRSWNKVDNFEADLRTKSGDIQSCQFTAELIDLEGEPHIFSVIRDITKQKQALKAGHLASIGELSAGIAHEINNPTNSIMLNAEMLLDMPEIDADERNGIAESIMKDSQRITNIVRSLLSFARADSNEKGIVNLNNIMRDTLMLTEQQIGKNGINLTTSIPSDMPEITANAQELEQVFINIVNNARYALNQKYPSSNAGKKLDISGSLVEMNNRPYVQLIFYDSGTGISEDIIKKVKAPFFTTKPADAGTGLGMSISHGIISDHKGTLEIESKESEYTRIIIKLPVEVENEPAGSSA